MAGFWGARLPRPLAEGGGWGHLGRNLQVGRGRKGFLQKRVSPGAGLGAGSEGLAVGFPFPWEQPLPVVSAGVPELFKGRTSKLLKVHENEAAAGTPWSVWVAAPGQLLPGERGTEPHAICPHPGVCIPCLLQGGDPDR